MSTIRLVPYETTKLEDAQEIVSIVLKYYPNTAFPPTVEKMLKTNIKYFRAFLGEEQIGMTGYDTKTPALVETVKTIVFDEFRGKKLGALLSQAVEDECKRVGFKKVMTTIYHFNHAMIAIKLKQGYTIEGYHPDHEAPGFHEYSLGKKLV